MKMPKRQRDRTSGSEGCRAGRRPTPQARHADVIAQASLHRMLRGF